MLFTILKLFGLDVPAKIEAVKAGLERRVEQTADHVKRVAQEAAIIAAFSAVASMTAVVALAVGMIAIYRWAAEAYGEYAGLAMVGGILVVVTIIFATIAAIKGSALAHSRLEFQISPPVMGHMVSDAGARAHATAVDAAPAPVLPSASADDLVEPLGFLLSRVVPYPSSANPVVNELIGSLRATARGTTEEAIGRAADVIRHGNRANLLVVLTGAAFVGWLLSPSFPSSGLNR
jgi:hypothetical protein